MSGQDSIHSLNLNGFNGNGTFEQHFDGFSRALDSPYSPGILETEIMSNRSSVYSDILNLNEKSHDFNNNRDSIMNVIKGNDELNQDNVDNSNFESKFVHQDGNLSDKQNGDNINDTSKQAVGSTLEAAALVDLEGISLDDDANWLFSKKPSHAISSNAINWIKGENDDTKKIENKSSPLKRYSSGKIEKFSDFGQVTQIIGVPPLSASNKDLSSIGKELSLNKQQEFENAEFETNLNDHQPSLTTSNGILNFGSGFVLADFNDVQNAAKLQEQSLRMSFSTPLVNSNKGLSLKGSSKKLNEAGDQNKLKLKTSQADRADGGHGRLPTRSPARNTAPLSQYNSNGLINKKLNNKSSNVEPFQKSLPNLTRKLQPVKAQTGGRVPRSMLPPPGPPVRTASQPTVTSQLKPFRGSQPQRTTSTHLKPQGMSLNQRNLNSVKKPSVRAPPTSLNTSARMPNTSRQPLSTRQPVSTTSRQPLSTTSRQPLSTKSRQPLSTTSRQPLSTTSRQPLSTTSRQPLSTTSRQPLSTTLRQPISANNRVPMSNTARLASTSGSRATTSRLASGTRSPLNNPPISNRGANISQARPRITASSSTTMTRNPPSLLNRTNQASTRTNLSGATNRTNLAPNRGKPSLIQGDSSASNIRSNAARNNMLSTMNRTKPVSNLNSTSFSSRMATNARAPPTSSNLLRNPSSRAATTNKPLSSARSTTLNNPINPTLSKARPVKPSPIPHMASKIDKGNHQNDREAWKDGCF